MNVGSAKIKKEIGVGGYLGRIFAFWGVLILGVVVCFGAAIGAQVANCSEATIWATGCLALLGYFGGHAAIWFFPAFCVDLLKSRSFFETAASFCCHSALGVAAAIGSGSWSSESSLDDKIVVLFFYLLYAGWLVFKLRDEEIAETARRLRWAIFAAVVVPATLGALALAGLYFSGAIASAPPTAKALIASFTCPALAGLGTAAATYGVFAFRVSRTESEGEPEEASDEFKGEPEQEPETLEVAEKQLFENDEK